jgi:hypothetical protein
MNREQRAQKIIQKPGYPDIYAQPPQTISDILRDIQTVMPSKLDNQYHQVSKHIQSIYIICPAKKNFYSASLHKNFNPSPSDWESV